MAVFECHSHRIDAVAQTGGFRTIGEHVAEMGTTLGTKNLSAHHAQTLILSHDDGIAVDHLVKARPATLGIKLYQ